VALELETTIMREIGLPSHYNRANGSGSCECIRKAAAARLGGAIQSHHDAGDAIEASDKDLVELVGRVAQVGDRSSFSLTKTWQACADAIRGHMEGVEGIAIAYEYIAKTYLPSAAEMREAERENFSVS
jgi:hypothetical protein